MKKIPYFILDVFAKNKYEGNQLAVYLDLENVLNQEDMLNIAKEINFAETTFIKKKITSNKYEVKIFTTESEIPFAGHPTLGTSFIIAKFLMEEPTDQLILDLLEGEIIVELSDKNQIDESLLTMTQVQPRFLKTFSKEEMEMGLGIPSGIIEKEKPIQEISTGLPFIIIPVKNLEAMNRIKLNTPQFIDFLKKHKIYKTDTSNGISTSLLFFVAETFEVENDFNVRMFCVEDEVLKEDAATGSANGCFLAYLLKYHSDQINAKVEQGFQMNRKSFLYLRGKREEEKYDIKVGGFSKLVSKGEWIA